MSNDNVLKESHGETWTMYNGDCCDVVRHLPDNSIHFGIHSPPFANLYIYSDSESDMGNCADEAEFIAHYEFLIPELLRVTVPGRLCAVHCKDLPKYANRDDTAGLKDFPGMIVAAFERHGWSFHSRVTIWKCPVVERERTNNNGLLHKTILRDRSQVRQGMADYLLVFRKVPAMGLMSDEPVTNLQKVIDEDGTERTVPGGFKKYIGDDGIDPRSDNTHHSPFARKHGPNNTEIQQSINIWRRYAEPVWWDVDQMDVLNFKLARSESDERHICPLQLGLIERAVDLWSNPGDVVLSPFAGIGSEGVGSLRQGRKFVGVELKSEYFDRATLNLERAEKIASINGGSQQKEFAFEANWEDDSNVT